MKNRVRWIIMLSVVALVSSSAWAAWDPDAEVQFLLDFTNSDNTATPPTTTDNIMGVTGTVVDYNSAGGAFGKAIFDASGKAGLGADANFMPVHDRDTSTPNDVRILMPNGEVAYPDYVFNLQRAASPVAADDRMTFSFWFNGSRVDNGTILRHDNTDTTDLYWEIRMYTGKMSFLYKPTPNVLRFETVSTLSSLGVTANTWHHASVVIDRTARNSCKIYIDGAETPILYTVQDLTRNMMIDPLGGYPLIIGAGERKFDGLVDEVRVYHKALVPLEASILYQTDGLTHPIALLPVPRSTDVAIDTTLTWVKSGNAQKIYFGTNSGALSLVYTDTAGIETLSNAQLSGPLAKSKTYYWRVDTDYGSGYVAGTTWSFTTETGKAKNPTPMDGQEYMPIGNVKMMWDEPTTHPTSYSVYLSSDRTLVESNSVTARILDSVDANDVNKAIDLRGTDMFWRVISNYTDGAITGDTWQFRMRPYEIVFNTCSTPTYAFESHPLPAYAVQVHGGTWFSLTADGNTSNTSEAAVIGKVGTDGTVIYDFNTFSFDRRFEIVVVPEYRQQDYNSTNQPKPIAIHVNNGGNFYFDGRINIDGNDIVTGSDTPLARSGGGSGPKKNQGNGTTDANFLNVTLASGTHSRYGNLGSKLIYCPNTAVVNRYGSNAYMIYGKGLGLTLLEKGGSGAGYGGKGGEGGRAYYLGMHGGGATYGDKQVPVPFGGSAGGWTDLQPGCPGGGGIEIVANNVTLDTNSTLTANAGASLASSESTKGCGGGSGGSVRIIGTGNVATKGIISANGSNGGNVINGQANNVGGGGAGGRVAIFYGGTLTPANGGNITVNGGLRGFQTDRTSIGKDGQNGTIYTAAFSLAKQASAPTPANGDDKVYAASGGTALTLKWYSGYSNPVGSDVVYFGTVNPPVTAVGSPVSATRGEHSATATVNIVPDKTYYFQVKTDGTVSSDVWSFKTVSWKCPLYVKGGTTHRNYNGSTLGIGGPEWDINGDCMLNELDFWYFANDWRNSEFGLPQNPPDQPPVTPGTYRLELGSLSKFAGEWLATEGRQ